MRKKEFLQVIKLAHIKLTQTLWENNYHGVCTAISSSLYGSYIEGTPILLEFRELTRHREDDDGYWYGARSRKNIFKRQIALDLFKEHCLQHKLYREF